MMRHVRKGAAETAWAAHRACAIFLTVFVVLTVLTAAAAWRLSRGPVALDFLKDRIERAANLSIAPARISIGTASIAWRGFSEGVNRPLVLRVTDLTIEQGDQHTRMHVPVADVALSVRALLTGRVVPRAITLQGARLSLVRSEDGTIAFDRGPDSRGDDVLSLADVLGVLGRPADTDRDAAGTQFGQLASISIRGAGLTLDDRRLTTVWSAQGLDLDVFRRGNGGLDGRAALRLGWGGGQAGAHGATLKATFALEPGARAVHATGRLAGLTPKALADAVPALAVLAALDAPVDLDGDADFNADLTLSHMRVAARLGTGQAVFADGAVPFRAAAIALEGTLDHMAIRSSWVELSPKTGGPVSIARAEGEIARRADGADMGLRLTLDQVDLADLPSLWPRALAKNARAWIAGNVSAGMARDGKADLALTVSPEGAVSLTRASIALEAEDAVVVWLPTLPPVDQARVRMTMTDPDRLDFAFLSARQTVRGADPIVLRSGSLTISGLMGRDQFATVRCEVSGSLPSTIAFLKEPRLRILDRHPVDLRAPTGEARMTVQARIPLEKDVRLDDVKIRGLGSLNRVHLTGIAAGRDVDDGAVTVDVDPDRMTMKGTARIGGIPATLDARMDFRAGPPTQVVQRFALTAKTNATALPGAGLNHDGALTGDIGVNAVVSLFRNGDGEVAVDADLTGASAGLPWLAWRKPVGSAAKGSARLKLVKDRLVTIDAVAIEGTGLSFRGAISMFDGWFDTIRVDRAVFGRNDFGGTVRVRRDMPVEVNLSGAALDLAAKLTSPPGPPGPPASPGEDSAAQDPAWSARMAFKPVYLAYERIATEVTASTTYDGKMYRALAAEGVGGTGKPFAARIWNDNGTRRVLASAGDGGDLAAGLDVTPNVRGGTLRLTGSFDDTTPDHVLSGTLDMSEYRVIKAPVLGKLLQAVTLYGLFDALGGEGLRFSSLIVPFQMSGRMLTLRDARAFSPSLGLTAKGRIDRGKGRLELEGSLVPAYVFNSLLGRIPLIGGLFTAEKDGGLIAMNYTLSGLTADPSVSVNPLSAVTPGILRGMFGLFDQSPSEPGDSGHKP